MSLASKEVAATGLLGGKDNNLLIIIAVFFIFCGCGRGVGNECCLGNIGSSSGGCRRRRRGRGRNSNSLIIWLIVILALIGGVNRNTNTNIININSDDDNGLDETTGF